MASFSAIQNEGFTVISNSLLRYYPSLKISETEAMLLLQLESFKQEKKFFPSDNNLSERMNLSPIEISQLIQNLIDKNLIELGQKRDREGRITNFYDLNISKIVPISPLRHMLLQNLLRLILKHQDCRSALTHFLQNLLPFKPGHERQIPRA